jgi:hypothetical protein
MRALDSFDPKKHSTGDLFDPDFGRSDFSSGGQGGVSEEAFWGSKALVGNPHGGETYLVSPTSSASAPAVTQSVSGDDGRPHPVPASTLIGQAGGLRINLEWDSSVASAPEGFMHAIETAAAFYTKMFTNNVVLNIAVGWNEFGGRSMDAGSVAESFNYGNATTDYQSLRSALLADASHSQIQAQADSTLPQSVAAGDVFWEPTAQQKALGLLDPNASGLDGAMGLSSAYRYSFSQDEIGRGTYDAVGEAEHELSEIMGRVSYLTTSSPQELTALDLFTYNSPGVRGLPGYFSIDGGKTNLGTFNYPATNGGDPFDWSTAAAGDAYAAFATTGVREKVSSTDLAVDTVLGWNLSAVGQKATTTLGLA